jgi:hypothetical protein
MNDARRHYVPAHTQMVFLSWDFKIHKHKKNVSLYYYTYYILK